MTLSQRYQGICLYTYYTSLCITLIGLFFSRVLISSGFLLFLISWLLEGNYTHKLETLKQNKSFAIVSLILIIHLIGLIYTQNIAYGLKDIQIKLPLLIPICFASSPVLVKSFKKDIFLLIYILAALLATLYGFIRFDFFSNTESLEDLYKLSVTGQNIQVSVFVSLAICFLFYLIFFNHKPLFQINKLILIACLIWFCIFIYLLNSYTGYLVFLAITIYSVYKVVRKKNYTILIIALCILILIIIATTIYLGRTISAFNYTEKVEFNKLPIQTANGNRYYHDTISKRTENGHFIDINICKEELKKSWKLKSKLPFENNDLKGQLLSETLIRYLSSKGLMKDSSGMAALTQQDISFIENGCANHLYTNKYSLKSRIYHLYWQYKKYSETGNSTAQSISQRIEFLKVAQIIAKENIWLGVGSGDVMDSFKETLEKTDSKLAPDYYNRVHNQYIVELITLGIWGFMAFTFIFFFPIFKYRIWRNYLQLVFYIIIFLSFLTDNPLETQLGVSFFTVFYCILIFENSQYKQT